MRPKTPSLAPPIIFGIFLVLVTITLTVLWNVALFTGWWRDQTASPAGPGYWVLLISGYVLFLSVIIGLILFIVWLATQIRLNQRQQNFIDSVTHELKSPLTSLKLLLETMQLRKVPPEKQEEFYRLMLADVERLNMLIDHVLEAARVDQRRKEYPLEELPLVPLLASAVEMTRQRHALPADAVQFESPSLKVVTNRVGLEIVLTNLLDNAVKYSQNGVRVTVKACATGDGHVAIAIIDEGVGIPRNQLKRIFQRFHRVGNELTRIRKGTGLGLYIVKETLRSLKGTIRAHSPGENQGSTFTITLPGGAHV
ncbi:MAG: sensor histidine kinase [Candidatus Sericytochromatia bacterium]